MGKEGEYSVAADLPLCLAFPTEHRETMLRPPPCFLSLWVSPSILLRSSQASAQMPQSCSQGFQGAELGPELQVEVPGEDIPGRVNKAGKQKEPGIFRQSLPLIEQFQVSYAD